MKLFDIEMDISLWLIFGSAFVLLVWTILKILGVFNTPPIILAVPYFTAIASIMGFGIALAHLFVKLGKVLEKINGLDQDMGEVKGDLKKVEVDIKRLDRDIGYVKGKLKIAG